MPEVKIPYIFGGVLLLKCATGANPPGHPPQHLAATRRNARLHFAPLICGISTGEPRLQLVLVPFSFIYSIAAKAPRAQSDMERGSEERVLTWRERRLPEGKSPWARALSRLRVNSMAALH